jgi:hypothetical protein
VTRAVLILVIAFAALPGILLPKGVHAGAQPTGRAIVLEPFADELGLGASAGQPEIDALHQANFTVDVFRNDEVTIPVMERLGGYAVIYVETHSGVLPNGDAVLLTGDTSQKAYAAFFKDGSVIQGYVSNTSPGALYDAVTGRFLSKHVAAFAPSTILFINGCGVLDAPLLWRAAAAQGADALIGWHGFVPPTTAEDAASLVMGALDRGATVAAAVDAVRAAVPDAGGLGFVGDGADTLSDALVAATPTPQSTAAPTAAVPPHLTSTPLSDPPLIRCRPRHIGACPDVEKGEGS